ncbi:MAG: hypothetical protein WC705_02930 [Candidatus Paceibacterota bacterium]|jgi:hypothetical protein
MDTINKTTKNYIIAITVLLSLGLFSGVSLAATSQENEFSRSFNRFLEEKESFRKSKSDQSGLIERAKSFLLVTIEVLEKRSLQIQDRISLKIDVYQDLGPYMSEEIKSNLIKLNELKESVSNSNNLEELRNISSQLISYRQDDEKNLKKLILLAHISRFEDTIIKTSQNRLEVINQKLLLIKNSRKNILALEKLSEQAEQQIADVQKTIDILKTNISQELISLSDISQIQKQLISITERVKDIYKIFKQIAVDGNQLLY